MLRHETVMPTTRDLQHEKRDMSPLNVSWFSADTLVCSELPEVEWCWKNLLQAGTSRGQLSAAAPSFDMPWPRIPSPRSSMTRAGALIERRA
jgi:hypothetical protein